MKNLIIITAFIGVLGLIFQIELYKFKDCKKVGHDNFYCFLTAGN